MERRNFLKGSSLFLFAAWMNPSTLLKARANTPVNPSADLLNGIIPDSASAAVSNLFVFPHYHYVYIPRDILANPPAEGFSTATSMVVADLGVSPTLISQNRHYHYHIINFSRAQIESIARGRRTVVEIYLQGKLNHQFVFDGRRVFERTTRNIRSDARKQRLPTSLPGPVIPRRVE